MALQVERRRLWEERRDNAIRLQEAGVRVYFGTGSKSPSDLLEKLQQLVEAGLPADYARAALTSEAARLLGVSNHLGKIVSGSAATLCIWSADPMTKDAQLALIAVDGSVTEFEIKDKKTDGKGPEKGVDLSGHWDFTSTSDGDSNEATLELTMAEDGTISGSLSMPSPMGEGDLKSTVSGSVSGTSVSMIATFDMDSMSITMVFDGVVDGLEISGTNTVSGPWGEDSKTFRGVHTPEHSHAVLNWGYEDHDEERYSCH